MKKTKADDMRLLLPVDVSNVFHHAVYLPSCIVEFVFLSTELFLCSSIRTLEL